MNWFKPKDEKIGEVNSASYMETERATAIERTLKYFQSGHEKFLWSVEPKFGKITTSYKLIEKMQPASVLVLVHDEQTMLSWWKNYPYSEYAKEQLLFISENSALNGYDGVLSREEYAEYIINTDIDVAKGMIAVDSVKGIRDCVYFGGRKDRLKWMTGTEFDLVIVDVMKYNFHKDQIPQLLHKIQRKHSLYLWPVDSNLIKREGFHDDQVFYWPQIVKAAPVKTVSAIEVKPTAPRTAVKLGEKREREIPTEQAAFLSQCTKEERLLIKEIEQFIKQKIKYVKIEDKGKRYTFTDTMQISVGEVAYAWMWLIKKDGHLIFRYKFKQNESDKEKYKENLILVNAIQLQTIKNIIGLLVER